MWCAYNILVCAVYWICECTPLAITSLLPVVLLPLTGVVSTNNVCINYLKVNFGFKGKQNVRICLLHGLTFEITKNKHSFINKKQQFLLNPANLKSHFSMFMLKPAFYKKNINTI